MNYTTTEPATLSPAPSASVLDEHAKGWRKKLGQSLLVLLIIFVASWYVGLLNFNTLANGVPAIGTLIGESLPPDFTNVASWVSPLIDTLAMSIAGTAIAVTLSVPLAFLAARNTSPHPVVFQVTRTLLNGLRSVPELIMGIIFVAAVGFGALQANNLRWGGTYNADTDAIVSVTAIGTSEGLVAGSPFPVPSDALSGLYFICQIPGTNCSQPNLSNINHTAGDWALCIDEAQGWVHINANSDGGGGGGGSTQYLNDLLDVEIGGASGPFSTAPAMTLSDKQLFKFDGGTGVWRNTDLLDGGNF